MSLAKAVIIVAGGIGNRMNSNIPKQFLVVKKKPVLFYTITSFLQFDPSIQVILVLPSNHIKTWKRICLKYNIDLPHLIVEGGETRFHSVKNGLELIQSEKMIAVHDGVRPFVSVQTLTNCFKGAEINGNAVPFVPVIDSLRFYENGNSKSINRSKYVSIQTPQVFRSNELKEAYNQKYNDSFTDDASVVESIGKKIYLVEGNVENIKITNPLDLDIAKAIADKLKF